MAGIDVSNSKASSDFGIKVQPEGAKLTPGQATQTSIEGKPWLKYLPTKAQLPDDKGQRAHAFANALRTIYPQYAGCSDQELSKTIASSKDLQLSLSSWMNPAAAKKGTIFPSTVPPPVLDKGPSAKPATATTSAPKLPATAGGTTQKKEWVEVDGYNDSKDKYYVITNPDGTKVVKDVGVYKAGDPRLDIGESDHIDPKLAQEDAFVRLAQKLYGLNPGQAYALLKTDAAFKAAHDKFMAGGDVKLPAKVNPPAAPEKKSALADKKTEHHVLKTGAPLKVGGATYTFEKGDAAGTKKAWVTAQAPLGYDPKNAAHRQQFQQKLAGDFYKLMATAYGLSTKQIDELVAHNPAIQKALAQFTAIATSGQTPDGKHAAWVTLPETI